MELKQVLDMMDLEMDCDGDETKDDTFARYEDADSRNSERKREIGQAMTFMELMKTTRRRQPEMAAPNVFQRCAFTHKLFELLTC